MLVVIAFLCFVFHFFHFMISAFLLTEKATMAKEKVDYELVDVSGGIFRIQVDPREAAALDMSK